MTLIDRHALVLSIWVPAGLAAAALAHFGLGAGGVVALGCAFLAVLAAFVGHVIVNAVTRTGFTAREAALGLVLYGAALVAFGLAAVAEPPLWAGRWWTAAGGFAVLFAAFVFYLVTTRGTRGAFDSFDVIRSFRAGAPGGRRRSR